MSEENTTSDVESENVIEENQEVIESDNPDVGQDEPSADEKEVIAEKIKELKLKVDGKEIIEELPFEIDPEHQEYFIKQLQLAKMSQSRAQKASELEKKDAVREEQLQSFLDKLQQNPAEILSNMGMDLNDFAQKIIDEEVEDMSLTEDQRKLKELEGKLKEKEEAEIKAKEEAQAARQAALVKDYSATFEKEVFGAIESGDLPNDPEVVNDMVNLLLVANENKIDLGFEDLIPAVRTREDERNKRAVTRLNSDQLLEILSEQTVKDLILKKSGDEKVKKEAPPTAQQIKDSGDMRDPDEGRIRVGKKSASDFFRNLTLNNSGHGMFDS